MLVEFKVGNYRSFREEQTLSLVASGDTELGGNCVNRGKLRLLKATGIYGPNASGKSNFIKAMDIMKHIVIDSTDYQPGKKLAVQPFLFDNKLQRKPSTFEVTFYHEKVRYQYGFTATSERVHDEWLRAYPKGRVQTWYLRKFRSETGRTDWDWGSKKLKGEREKLKDKTRDNVLFLSVGAQWNNKQLTSVHEWFRNRLQVIGTGGYFQPITAEMLWGLMSEKNAGKYLHKFITNSLQNADLGISGVRVEKVKVDEIKFMKGIPEKIREELIEKVKVDPMFKVKMLHRNKKTGENIYLPLQEESDGTRRFFELIGPWLIAVIEGITIFVDEIESSLHPLLVRELIKFIQNPELKRKGAQLIFATHDTTLLDPELFRRDQIWFTEKDEHNSTRLYPLSDYKPRKGEAMQKGYLSGRYGAIPIIEAFELNG
jgi:AAA15 family ATPase/GTPase